MLINYMNDIYKIWLNDLKGICDLKKFELVSFIAIVYFTVRNSICYKYKIYPRRIENLKEFLLLIVNTIHKIF